jgi:hypothetical protein
VDNGKIKVINCPAEQMWADILTEPLQGMAFRTMRAVLMNCPVNYEDKEEVTKTKLTKSVAVKPVPVCKMVSWKNDICTFYQCRSPGTDDGQTVATWLPCNANTNKRNTGSFYAPIKNLSTSYHQYCSSSTKHHRSVLGRTGQIDQD